MKIFPTQPIADQLGLAADGISVLAAEFLWVKRDRYSYSVEALVEIEIAYETATGFERIRRKTLVNVPMSRGQGVRSHLLRAAALLTAMLAAPTLQAEPALRHAA